MAGKLIKYNTVKAVVVPYCVQCINRISSFIVPFMKYIFATILPSDGIKLYIFWSFWTPVRSNFILPFGMRKGKSKQFGFYRF